jgi:hypothetical protein
MSTDFACFLFGIVTTAFWLYAVGKGIMPRNRALLFGSPGGGWVYRSASPARFWVVALLLGVFALAPLVFPVLSWLGWRH